MFDRNGARFATFTGGAWELGILRCDEVRVDDERIVGARLAKVANPTGGTTVDTEARSAIGNILSRLRDHGLIDS